MVLALFMKEENALYVGSYSGIDKFGFVIFILFHFS